MGLAKEFPIEKMDGFRIGNAQNEEAGTGVTVVLFDKDKGARAGVDVSGGGPASRETPAGFSADGRQSSECHCIIRRLCLWTGCF